MYTIRVYHLSDLVHIEEDSELLPEAWRRKSEETANQLKLRGNEAVKQKKWWTAINEYSRALRQNPTEEEKVIIKRNRALAFIRTSQFDAALEDTGFPDFGELPNDKALYRAGEALYTLQRFKECADVVGLLRSKFPDSRDAKPLEEKVKIRIKEQDTGVYDFAGMQKQAARTTPPLLDHATYIGPMEVKNTKKKGRGMFTTRPVKAGELLLCEKAFAYVWVDSNGSNAHPLMNLALRNLQFGGQLMLIRDILQKLSHTPSKVESIGKLHHGTYKPADNTYVDGKPVVDTFLVERIVDLNGFGFERRSLDTLNRRRYHTPPPLGLWATAAYMNHSCVSSAHRACIGSMMIIRAEHDLPAGTELTLQYMSPGQGAEPGSIGNCWGIECNCAYCDDYKSTPARKLEQRKALREMYNQTMGARQINFPKVKQYLRQLADTFSKPVDQVPRYELLELYWGLMAAAADRGEWALCLSAVGELLRVVGYQVEGFGDKKGEKVRILKFGMGCAYAIEGLMLAREALKKLGRAGEIDDVTSLAKTTYKITLGEDETFHESYKDLMEGRKEWGY
ncbi:hypothetical protein BS50DRAFT_644252 [Corynespora cassiicola Philippines]|uniref:SET domain-containing protein n=1 Tax=Corynespora cassiicola Philippines TaxID=1448308 RepID=A0A2T2PCI4_CORCC|nr:hypothetical protein BS50DRAFT_644252 [Corynespora cassiicola Philippines]